MTAQAQGRTPLGRSEIAAFAAVVGDMAADADDFVVAQQVVYEVRILPLSGQLPESGVKVISPGRILDENGMVFPRLGHAPRRLNAAGTDGCVNNQARHTAVMAAEACQGKGVGGFGGLFKILYHDFFVVPAPEPQRHFSPLLHKSDHVALATGCPLDGVARIYVKLVKVDLFVHQDRIGGEYKRRQQHQ